jgi:hypothetical protein
MLLEAVTDDTICKVQVLPLQKCLLRPSATDHPWLDLYTQFTLQCTRYSGPKCIAHNVLSLPSLPFGLHWAIQCNCTTWLHLMFGILSAYSLLVTGALAKPFKGLSWYSLRWWCWSILWRSYCFGNANQCLAKPTRLLMIRPGYCNICGKWIMVHQYRPLTEPVLVHDSRKSIQLKRETFLTILEPWGCLLRHQQSQP